MFANTPLELLLLLLAAGVVAGFINTVAGGGSLLTLPALALLGLPWDVANATNRVGVLLQTAVSSRQFHAAGHLDPRVAGAMLVPSLIGAGAGALTATVADPRLLEPVILVMLFTIGLLMALRPKLVLAPRDDQPRSLREHPGAWAALLLAGFYGGFLQAGVGYFLLAILGGTLRYDLVRGNALKGILVAGFTALALAVFIAADLVNWPVGLLLGAASVAGSVLGVRFAMRVPQEVLRWLVVATLGATCVAVLVR